MKKLIVANWKNLPSTFAEARDILETVDERLRALGGTAAFDLVICPPPVLLDEVAAILPGDAALGAQDMPVAHSAVRYVIIGHSDRRWKLGESDVAVNAKLKDALAQGLAPIVCLGERTREGNPGRAGWRGELRAQAEATFEGFPVSDLERCLVAYEPVWAISTNPGARPDTPESALESMKIIRDVFIEHWKLEIGNLPRMLYGGSVTSANLREFLGQPDIDGVLVGGASVRKDDFGNMLVIANSLT